MSKSVLKYRAVCPCCNKGFDSRTGVLFWGQLICPECEKEKIKYNQSNDYRK